MENIEACLLKIAEQEGIIDPVINYLPKIGAGQGYLAKIEMVNLHAQTKSDKDDKLSLVLKIAATNEKLRQCTAVFEIFRTEIRMYESIFPAFHEFEKQRGIEIPFNMVPKCYKLFGDTKPEIIIFENLNQSGYQNWNSKLFMDSEHVKAILREYGRFHALSFAIRDQNPLLFQQLTNNFDNHLITFLKRSGFSNAFINSSKRMLAFLDSYADSKIFRKYEEFLKDIDEKWEFLISDCDKFYALLHGDCWWNNMLFKYNDIERTYPSEIRFIDFQLTRLGSPVLDIVYFFYICSSEDVLKELQVHKDTYYDSLSHHLKALGSNADRVYPVSVYEEHWKKYSIFGLILCPLVINTLLSEENEIVNFAQVIEEGRTMEEAFAYETINIEAYKTRMKTIIEHFVDNNFI